MTFNKTTPPSTAPEPAPQYCGDDPFGLGDIPAFLRRTPGAGRVAPLCSGASAHMEPSTRTESPELQAKGN